MYLKIKILKQCFRSMLFFLPPIFIFAESCRVGTLQVADRLGGSTGNALWETM